MQLFKVGKYGNSLISWHRGWTHHGIIFPSELIIWPFRLLIGGNGRPDGVRLFLRERGVSPPFWNTLWPRTKKNKDDE